MTELSKAIKRLEDTLEITDGGEHMIVKSLDVAAVLLMLESLQDEVAMLKKGWPDDPGASCPSPEWSNALLWFGAARRSDEENDDD